jgi:hypothetical protein
MLVSLKPIANSNLPVFASSWFLWSCEQLRYCGKYSRSASLLKITESEDLYAISGFHGGDSE